MLPSLVDTQVTADHVSVKVDKALPVHPRVVLYSHDTMGLGHLRRNTMIARALAQSPLEANVLMISGASIAKSYSLPVRVDCLTLPSLYKETDGSYRSRSLELSLLELLGLRRRTIRAALEAFEPDVLVVDAVPQGVEGELRDALKGLRDGGRTQCVLGLRDVLDAPGVVQREWQSKALEAFIDTYYERVWIYGDKRIFNPIAEYRFSRAIAAKVKFTGYFDRRPEPQAGDPRMFPKQTPALPSGRIALCLVGGGQDGAPLADAFAQAPLPEGCYGILLTGPFMPPAARAQLDAKVATRSDLTLLEFHPEPTMLIERADSVVAMGGYNTVSEILSFGKRALIIPRVKPRLEQFIRAERLKRQGLIDVCHPDAISPGVLGHWLGRRTDQEAEEADARPRVDLGGLARLPTLVSDILTPPQAGEC